MNITGLLLEELTLLDDMARGYLCCVISVDLSKN